MRLHTTGRPIHECSVCKQCFHHFSHLQIHKRLVHSNRRPHHWPYCGKLFNIKHWTEASCSLWRHERAKPYVCSECPMRFCTSYALRHRHMVHSDIKHISCGLCDRSFKHSETVVKHFEMCVAVLMYRHCSDCFRRLDQLNVHLLKSHGEGTWFTCKICQKKFSQNCHLKADSAWRHEGVKPYVCSECQKRFCTSREPRLHRLVNSDITHFSCGLCNKSFKHPETVVKTY